MRRFPTVLPATALTIVLAACSAAPSPGPDPAFGAALDRTLAAGSYAYEATVHLAAGSRPVTVELAGWVDGDDRLLVMTTGGETVRTTVVDGVATVEDASGSRPVPLADAAAPPSLEALRGLSPSEATGGRVRGTIDAAAGAAVGIDGAAGTVDVDVTYTDVITGYALADRAGRWDLAVTFRGVGDDPTP